MNECLHEVKSVTGQVLKIYDDHIELTQKGARGVLTQGLQGSKSIYFSDISSVQFKNCGWTAGFFEFTFSGGIDRKGGSFSGALNDNRFSFGKPTIGAAKKLAKEMETVNNDLQRLLREYKSVPAAGGSQQISNADEILKFKQLLDMGTISEEEFEAKKKQLLGI